ncbi:hypothetical protein DM02DRAFT_685125 [Periconia macrospinosa]|uniref:Uncharacterized protein n=1 Tax=Periconia macrospinosa TaxID=97972 RepID=A0A2V1DGV7_9PLEO|nr:hypothetical protein DM02DRAFT_685125 [Periconia macrospinosa]
MFFRHMTITKTNVQDIKMELANSQLVSSQGPFRSPSDGDYSAAESLRKRLQKEILGSNEIFEHALNAMNNCKYMKGKNGFAFSSLSHNIQEEVFVESLSDGKILEKMLSPLSRAVDVHAVLRDPRFQGYIEALFVTVCLTFFKWSDWKSVDPVTRLPKVDYEQIYENAQGIPALFDLPEWRKIPAFTVDRDTMANVVGRVRKPGGWTKGLGN